LFGAPPLLRRASSGGFHDAIAESAGIAWARTVRCDPGDAIAESAGIA